MDFDAIVFDLDGTLVDSQGDIARALTAAFEAIGHRPDTPVRSLADGSPLEEIHRRVLPEAPASLAAFCDGYRSAYESHTTRLFDGIAELLDKLAPIPLAIATSKPPEVAQRILEGLGVAGIFDAICGSGLSPLPPKPAPDLLLHTLGRLGAEPERSAFVGDTPRDVLAGKAAGMTAVGVTWGMADPANIAAAGPHCLVHRPAELLTVLRPRT